MTRERKRITIAIDGHSSSGKSTMAKELAREIGYAYIDTGAMYRAVTLYCLQNGLFDGDRIDEERLAREIEGIRIRFVFNAETGRPDTYLNDVLVEQEIRSMEVANRVSEIAALGFVRRVMVAQQKEMGRMKGVVMDGRDVGTVIFPDAELKVFVTASPEIRAQRRLDELKSKGMEAAYEEVLQNVMHRDHIDSTRAEGPLRQAEDARVLDNSAMTREEQREVLRRWAEEAIITHN